MHAAYCCWHQPFAAVHSCSCGSSVGAEFESVLQPVVAAEVLLVQTHTHTLILAWTRCLLLQCVQCTLLHFGQVAALVQFTPFVSYRVCCIIQGLLCSSRAAAVNCGLTMAGQVLHLACVLAAEYADGMVDRLVISFAHTCQSNCKLVKYASAYSAVARCSLGAWCRRPYAYIMLRGCLLPWGRFSCCYQLHLQ